jgi:ABC-type transport system substrate-binding protein
VSGAHRWLPALGIALSVACGPGASDEPDDLAKTTTLTVLNPGGDGIFGPDWASKFLVFLPLIRSAADGSLEGQLAQSWEHTPDYRSWVFHLRSGLKWHDGEPVTARDVKFSLDLLSHPEVLYDPPGRTVTVVDDTTVDIAYDSSSGTSGIAPWGADPTDS